MAAAHHGASERERAVPTGKLLNTGAGYLRFCTVLKHGGLSGRCEAESCKKGRPWAQVVVSN